jgi:hypothetical protein
MRRIASYRLAANAGGTDNRERARHGDCPAAGITQAGGPRSFDDPGTEGGNPEAPGTVGRTCLAGQAPHCIAGRGIADLDRAGGAAGHGHRRYRSRCRGEGRDMAGYRRLRARRIAGVDGPVRFAARFPCCAKKPFRRWRRVLRWMPRALRPAMWRAPLPNRPRRWCPMWRASSRCAGAQ